MGQKLVPVVRHIVGAAPEQVENALRTTHAAGRLVTRPQDIRPRITKTGRYAVSVTVLEPAPKQTLKQRLAELDRRHPIGGPVLKALTFSLVVLVIVAAVLFGIGFALVGAIGMHAIKTGAGSIVGLGIVVILIWLFRSGGSGHGDHKGMGWHYTKCK